MTSREQIKHIARGKHLNQLSLNINQSVLTSLVSNKQFIHRSLSFPAYVLL